MCPEWLEKREEVMCQCVKTGVCERWVGRPAVCVDCEGMSVYLSLTACECMCAWVPSWAATGTVWVVECLSRNIEF